MKRVYDVIVIGRGPAGLAAAIGARSRNRTVLVVGNPEMDNPLAKSEQIPNYPGIPDCSGAQLLERLADHAQAMGAEFLTGRAISAMDTGKSWYLTVGSDFFEGTSIIIATGVSRGVKYPGEERLLGRGVSYCATCDGMLYRNRSVVVVGRAKSAPEEANYLSTIGCQVTYVAPTRPAELAEGTAFVKLSKLEILGEDRVRAVQVGETLLDCQGVFLLRESVAPTELFPGLALEEGHIVVNRRQETNLPRLYAAGDCTGGLLQVAKAVGEGLTAGEYAAGA